MSASPANPSHPTVAFADWSAQLEADASLSPGLRASYRVALTRFLAFCARRGTAPTVALAREHVDLVRLEHTPSPGRLQEWKDALKWYSRHGRAAATVALKGVPPLARSDLGTAPCEAALIARLRQEQRSWRTEQTYRGWLWRFMDWLESGRKGLDTSPSGAGVSVSAPHLIRPAATFSPERRRNLPGRGGEGRSLADVTGAEVRAFLTKLATEERISAATQRQAFSLVEG